jgi:signal transduction histidine kinase
VQTIAREALDHGGNGAEESARMLRAVPVVRWGRRHAALVARPTPSNRARCLLMMRAAGEVIGMVLERQALLDRGASRERSLVQASERRLASVAFDLHDGPLQDLAVVAAQAGGLRRDIGRVVDEPATRAGLLEQLAEVQARLVSVERDVRSLCHSLQSDGMLKRPFAEVIAGEGEAFTERTGIPADVEVSGEVDHVGGAQRIALLRIVQECLSNVREHANAGRVRLCVSVSPSHVEASVSDDGRGFEVERTLVAAARRGRLGLVGVHERARLLGGVCGVQSRPGGPTKIAVVLPRGEADEPAHSAGDAVTAPA